MKNTLGPHTTFELQIKWLVISKLEEAVLLYLCITLYYVGSFAV